MKTLQAFLFAVLLGTAGLGVYAGVRHSINQNQTVIVAGAPLPSCPILPCQDHQKKRK